MNGTIDFVIWYSKNINMDLAGFYDDDWVGNTDDRKSTNRGCFYLGNNLISWHNKKQNSISLSIVEVEYIIVGSFCTQLLWMKQMLEVVLNKLNIVENPRKAPLLSWFISILRSKVGVLCSTIWYWQVWCVCHHHLTQIDFFVSHIFNVGNQVVDKLTFYTVQSSRNCWWHSLSFL